MSSHPMSSPPGTARTPLIFISYSHKDDPDGEAWLEYVRSFLRPLEHYAEVSVWHDRRLRGGDEWESEIEEQLRHCTVFILLISRYSLVSDYVVGKELARIDARRARGEVVHVYPIVLSSTPDIAIDRIRRYNLRPRDGAPLESFAEGHPRNSIMTAIANELAKILKEQRSREGAPGAAPSGSRAAPPPASPGGPASQVRALPLPREKHLYGRDADSARLEAALTSNTVVAVTAVEGLGGIGKTALACQVARKLQRQGRFADGISFIDLRGYSTGTAPVAPVNALQTLIRDVTGTFDPLPDDVARLHGMWQDAVVGQDRLILLDNAINSDQVAPLIPDVDGPLVLITARSEIICAGQVIDLESLDDRDGAALAESIANVRRTARLSSAEAIRLTKLCQGLPKAIELAAGYLVKHPSMAVREYLDRLEQAPGSTDDPVRAAIGLTLEALDDQTRARFAALAVFAGPAEREAIRAVWNTDDPDQTLNRLMSQFLVDAGEADGARRFSLHDRVRAVAASLLGDDTDHDNTTRLRHATWFAHLLNRANRQYFEHGEAAMAALALFDRNRPDILAARDWLAPRVAKDDQAAQAGLAFADWGVVALRLTSKAGLDWHQIGQRAAERLGDKTALAAALGNSGLRALQMGDLDAAADYFNRGLEIDEELGPKGGIAFNLGNLGLVARRRGDLDGAEDFYNRALAINEELGRKEGMAANLGNLGLVAQDRGDLDAAADYFNRSLEIDEGLGGKEGMAVALGNLGPVAKNRGDLDAAEEYYNRALAIDKELGQKEGIARHLGNLGRLEEARGDTAKAVQLWRQALALYTELGMQPKIEKYTRWIAQYE